MYVVFALVAVVLYVIGVELFWEPTSWVFLVVLAPIVVSLFGMVFIRLVVEDIPLSGMFNPKMQSWAFLFGDGIALPLALLFIVLARGGQNVPGSGSLGWYFTAAIVGLAGGAGFHVMETDAYRKQDAALALESPTKSWHDFVVYPVLLGLIVWGGGPLLLPSAWDFWTILAIAALLVWVTLGVKYDAKRKPRPYDMHPAWDPVKFAVISR